MGTYLTHPLVARLFEPLFAEVGVAPPLLLPSGVEVTTRSGPTAVLTFIQNTTDELRKIDTSDGEIVLPAYGSTVLRAHTKRAAM
jgi:hypothetical protein